MRKSINSFNTNAQLSITESTYIMNKALSRQPKSLNYCTRLYTSLCTSVHQPLYKRTPGSVQLYTRLCTNTGQNV